MSHPGRMRARLVALSIPALFAVVLSWWTYARMRQDRLDRDLIAALYANDMPAALQIACYDDGFPGQDIRPGRKAVVLTLLRRGANPHYVGENGATPLMLAAYYDWPDVVRVLLSQRSQVNAVDLNGWTALMYGVGDGEVTRQLLSAGADVDAHGAGARTALMSARYVDDPTSASLLIARGADVNATDQDGWTALMFAASYGNTALVHNLIAAGARVNAQEHSDGQTATDMARARLPDPDARRIVETLRQAGANDSPHKTRP